MVREVAIGLYKYDYLNQEDVEKLIKGEKLEKKEVREYDNEVAEYISY